jgi:hypothetical protein
MHLVSTKTSGTSLFHGRNVTRRPAVVTERSALLHALQQVECSVACRCDRNAQQSINFQQEPLRVGTTPQEYNALDKHVRGNVVSIGKYGNVVLILAPWSVLPLLLL